MSDGPNGSSALTPPAPRGPAAEASASRGGEPLGAAKGELLAILRELGELAEGAGARSLADGLFDERIPRLEAERLHLVVLGEFNHGKTTFVNALLGGEVLPMGVTPTTAVVHEIAHGPDREAAIVFEDGRREALPVDQVGSWVVGGGGLKEGVRHLELTEPSALLEGGLVLVDTPGVNDLNLQRAEITYGYVPRADAVIFLLDAGQILKDSERSFLAGKLLSGVADRVLFVLNKVDLLDDAELAEAIAYAETHLAELLPTPKLFPVSAERALRRVQRAPGTGGSAREEGVGGHDDDDDDDSGMPGFVDALTRYLREERGRVLLAAAVADGRRVVAVLRSGLEAQQRALAMERDELTTRLEGLEGELALAGSAREEREARIREALIGVKAVVEADVERFAARFAEELPREIDEARSDDLRRFLPGFLEDRFRSFADEEARDVARRLERIAEDAIAFLGEDMEKREGRLKDALGAAAPRLELGVDTFAYDVGVFALGAFGLALMALSNALVGGAMTLAAPILAVVFRGRADQELKRRAAEDAPKAVAQAASEMRAAFGRQIDAFGERLTTFLREADEEMTQSLAEVLREVQRAAQEGEPAKQDLERRSGQHLARLGALDARLAAL
jgi:GTPase SAR1 family protein